MRIKKINKKGQLSGITWIPAFVVVFFVMFFLVLGSIALAGRREISGGNEDIESMTNENSNIANLQEMLAVLKTDISYKNDRVSVLESSFMLKEGGIDESILEEKIEELFDSFSSSVYLFKIYEGSDSLLEVTNIETCSGSYKSRQRKRTLLNEEGDTIIVNDNEEKLNFKLYKGECP